VDDFGFDGDLGFDGAGFGLVPALLLPGLLVPGLLRPPLSPLLLATGLVGAFGVRCPGLFGGGGGGLPA